MALSNGMKIGLAVSGTLLVVPALVYVGVKIGEARQLKNMNTTKHMESDTTSSSSAKTEKVK